MARRIVYPFCGILGQEKVKRALVISIVNPRVGGVLISGEKGTGKSTMVRGFFEVFNYIAFSELPLNATEDKIFGSIDMEHAVKNGERKFEPGILKRVDEGVLYIDEINLLSESIANSLLEVISSKVNKVEREGVSFEHSCRCLLIGSMNPEEGRLKGEFLDRFGLYVSVHGEKNSDIRLEIIKRRLEYERNPMLFCKKYVEKGEKLKEKIEKAKKALASIEIDKNMVKLACIIVGKANCEGHRGEIMLVECARTIAALEDRRSITLEDLKEAAGFILPHRMRVEKEDSIGNDDNGNQEDNSNSFEESSTDLDELPREFLNEIIRGAEEICFDIDNRQIKELKLNVRRKRVKIGSGKRNKVMTYRKSGRYIKYTYFNSGSGDIAFDATLRAAALMQSKREKKGNAVSIKDNDIRYRVREKRSGVSLLFVVDGSGSMGVKKRMAAVKGTILSMLQDAYEKRDRVGLLAFREDKAENILNITGSIDLAQKSLKVIKTGGKTPLSLGIYSGYKQLKGEMMKSKDIIPVMVLVTDGRANISMVEGRDSLKEAIDVSSYIKDKGIYFIVIDTEQGFMKFQIVKKISEALNGDYYKLDEINESGIKKLVRDSVKNILS